MPEPESEPFIGPIGSGSDSDPFSEPVILSQLGRIFNQIKRREKGLLILGGLAQLLFLVAMAIPHASTAMTGETILLQVIPVDPRDLFRGDYVTLSYEISRVPNDGIDNVPISRLRDPGEGWQGRIVYVGLVPETDGRHYRRSGISFNPPPSGKYLRGTLDNAFRITFGLESYYVQEGKGKVYEDAIRKHKLSAVVALASDGSSTLRGLIIETD